MVEKPASVVQKETFDALVDIINESRLPAFIVASMLKELLEQANTLAEKEYQRDLAQYKQAQSGDSGEIQPDTET